MFAQSLGCLITERLTSLGQDLGSLANERESQLREENQVLIKENDDLRRRLQSLGDDQPPPVGNGVKGAYKERWEKEKFLSISSVDFVKPDSVQMESSCLPIESKEEAGQRPRNHDASFSHLQSNGQEFKLLPELCDSELSICNLSDLEAFDKGYAVRASHINTKSHISLESVAVDKFMIDPSSSGRLAWDLLGIPVLGWDLITIPLGVFESIHGTEALFDIADWVTLAYWSMDIPLTFMTGVYNEDGEEIYSRRQVARKYIRGNLALDLFIVLTDWIQTFIENVTSADPPGLLKNMSILRILRISRFVRLLRLKRLKKKLQAVEDVLNNEWYLMSMQLLYKMFTVLVINHYIACGWYWLGNRSWAPQDKQWLTSYRDGGDTIRSTNFAFQYTTCLHWAIAQFTPGPMNIQPQNTWERLYNIGVLFFGLVMFSSFIASVTQARLQMTKLVSRFEREYFLLREFCREHKISSPLQLRMKRYIDMVVLPNISRQLAIDDVAFIKKLSPNLRQQMNTELFSEKISTYPFISHLHQYRVSVMHDMCNHAIEKLPLARGDVAFTGGHVANIMIVIVSGFCDYIPMRSKEHEVALEKGQWASEGSLWTKWMHQGQLQASTECESIVVFALKFGQCVLRSHGATAFSRGYGSAFCVHLNELLRDGMPLTDILLDFPLSYFRDFVHA